MITTPTVSGKPGQAPTGLSCDLYPLIGSQHLERSSGSRHTDPTAATLAGLDDIHARLDTDFPE
jgi:hypothetical protein